MPEKSLHPEKIAKTANLLSRRVFERFPNFGLYRISKELQELGYAAQENAPKIARPIYSVRIAVVLLILVILVIVGSMVWAVIPHLGQVGDASVIEIVAALEAGTNELVLIGLSIFFLVNLETRIKRGQAVRAIHELRCIAHVIDMHQLLKDPARFRHASVATESSPERELALPDMMRYLDYCSEMLSLTSKIAALYIQRFNDRAVMEAVSDVEVLCTGLSSKIWQKLQIAESALGSKKVATELS
ncbi:MAG: hypothetical protein K0U72_14000 [Gammaproteobacteria bacterium]|nr:hypothetical protein [Gammaproteobacteria bacterium]